MTLPSNLKYAPPSSILIIGAGVFGLSTALALTKRAVFANTSITIIDRSTPTGSLGDDLFPAHDASSVDSSRIVRADYSDPAYTALGRAAQEEWRKTGPGELGEGTYFESGLVFAADSGPSASAVKRVDTKKKKTAMDYVRDSYENVKMAPGQEGEGETLVSLGSAVDLMQATGAAGHIGDWGYLNRKSGWADAEGGMKWLTKRVKDTGRVRFVPGTVEMLLWANESVTGVRLIDGRELLSDLCILAAGGWTGRLADMKNICTSTGQALGYLNITEEEERTMEDMPVILNFSTGLFVLPPRNRILKVARHAYGYFNPVQVPSSLVLPPKPPSASDAPREGSVTISLPVTTAEIPTLQLPLEAQLDLRQCLRSYTRLAELADRPWAATRLCWYNDTADGNFLVDYHPHWRGLFVATGGSGHAYKFLPVLGEAVVDVMVRDPRSDELRKRWVWREGGKVKIREGFDAVVTEDGSRSGRLGMVLQEELRKRSPKL